jgi:hypothetical protein
VRPDLSFLEQSQLLSKEQILGGQRRAGFGRQYREMAKVG